jgi:transmembrane sensor
MIHYTDYSAEELAMDTAFQQWIQHPDPDSERRWQSWLEQYPNKWEVVQEARQLVLFMNLRKDRPAPQDESNVWAKIDASTQNQSAGLSAKPKATFRYWQPFIGVAVVAGLVIVGSMLFFLNSRHSRYATDYGQIKEITLPDGSQVIVNAHSTLEVASHWQEGQVREVWLEGEAFFKVKKKARHTPFIVHTKDMNVEVLGTEFNVSSRTNNQPADQPLTQVVLNSGKVKLTLEQQAQSVLMEPGDLVEWRAKQTNLSKKRVKPELYSSWARKEWMLENTSLQEVKDRLEQTFGLEVHMGSADIVQERMSGVVSTENLDELLDALSTINGLTIRKEGKKIFISR